MGGSDSPVTGVSHIQLRVSDVAVSERWYALVLGLDRLTAADDGTYVALRHRPSKVVVVLSAAAADPPELESGRLDHIAFAVPDGPALIAWADQLADLGVEHSGVADEDGRPSLILTDPDGIQIELVAPPPR